MEFVVGKTVHLSIMGFLVGLGIDALRHVDAYVKDGVMPVGRTPLSTVAAATAHLPSTTAAAAAPLLPNRPPAAALPPKPVPAAATAAAAAAAAPPPPPPRGGIAAFWFGPLPRVPPPALYTALGIRAMGDRPLWQQVALLSAVEGARTARVLGTGAFVMGVAGFVRHGRDVNAIYDFTRDQVPLACGAAAAALLIVPAPNRALRTAAAVGAGVATYWLAARRAHAVPPSQPPTRSHYSLPPS